MDILHKLTEEAQKLASNDDWREDSLRSNTQILTIDTKNVDAYIRLGIYFSEKHSYIFSREMLATSLFLDKENRIARNKIKEVQSKLIEAEVDINDLELSLADISNYFEALAMGIALQAQGKSELGSKFIMRSAAIGKPRKAL